MTFTWAATEAWWALRTVTIGLINLARNNTEALKELQLVEHSAAGVHTLLGCHAYCTMQGNGTGTPGIISGTSHNIARVDRTATGTYKFTYSDPHTIAYSAIFPEPSSTVDPYLLMCCSWESTVNDVTVTTQNSTGAYAGVAVDLNSGQHLQLVVM